ncbi:MAG: hypothetical protein QXE31_06020 [Candidatus Woesearchaeota archaeon]
MIPFNKLMHNSNLHFTLPFQLIQGVIYFLSALLLIFKKIGKNYVPFIPENILIYICIIGALIGGFYMILSRFHRAKIIL